MALEDFAGFGVWGYRSFGGKPGLVGPMSKVHLVVGRNNVGKSNVLSFMHESLSKFRDGHNYNFRHYFPRDLDKPEGWDYQATRQISIGLNLTETVMDAFGLNAAAVSLLKVLDTDAYSRGFQGTVWFDFDIKPNGDTAVSFQLNESQFKQAISAIDGHGINFSDLSSRMTTISGGSEYQNFERIVNSAWAPWQFIPQTDWVDAVREVKAAKEQSGNGRRNGNGLIGDLARIQNPGFANLADDTKKFNDLQEFVRDVLDDESARIQIPDDKDTIITHTTNGARPLEALGTGISEVVHLAAVATGVSGLLICIEEPEIHLHPTLQRKLIEYLNTSTTNRYLISTHSAQLLNAEIASISHATLNEEGWTHINQVVTPSHVADAAFDLGNRASDIVQSNFIIWVEGPADRIYLVHWISQLAGELIEGAHYSIMFYGGALLNHLSADDAETGEFIKLLNINRKLALVIDSDKQNESDRLNATKQRIIKELSSIGAQSWVTEGYTIENYVPHSVLKQAISDEYPTKTYNLSSSSYTSPLGKRFSGQKSYPSKVMIARRVAQKNVPVSDWSNHLKLQLRKLVKNIRAANDLPLS